MIRWYILLGLTAASVGVSPSARAEDAAPRWAVVVGTNVEVLGRNALRFAHRDAKMVSQALTDLGGFEERRVRLLLDPRPKEVLTAIDAFLTKAAGTPNAMVLFYYSGHADAGSLYPDGAPLPLTEIKRRLEDRRVQLRVGIVDACRGGGWTGTKGFATAAPFAIEVPDSPEAQGTIFVASSSGDQAAHESESLAGSFFTHHFVAGLRGAADDDADGVIAMSEAYRYARRRTVRDAAIYAQGEQHPSFRVTLTGRQDVSMTQIDRGRSTMTIGPRPSIIQVVDLNSGVTLVEVPAGKMPRTLALPEGSYVVKRRDDTGAAHVKEVDLRAGVSVTVEDADLRIARMEALRPKAAVMAAEDSVARPGGASVVDRVQIQLRGVGDTAITYHLRQVRTRGSIWTNNDGFDDVVLDSFVKLCTAPCEAAVPPGVNVFALSRGIEEEIVRARPIDITPSVRLEGEYIDNSDKRFVGYGIGGALAALGAGFTIAAIAGSVDNDLGDDDFGDSIDRSGTYVMIGVGGLIVGSTIAIISAYAFADRAVIRSEAP